MLKCEIERLQTDFNFEHTNNFEKNDFTVKEGVKGKGNERLYLTLSKSKRQQVTVYLCGLKER